MPTTSAAGVFARSPRWTGVARVVAVAVGVWAAGQATLSLPTFGTSVYPVWLPAAVMLFALYRWPTAGTFGGVAVGVGLVNAQVMPILPAMGVCAGTAVGYAVAAVLLRRWGLLGGLTDTASARRFLLACAAAPAVSAVNGPLWMAATGEFRWPAVGPAVLQWWLGDAVGVLVLGPVLFLVGVGGACPPKTRREFGVAGGGVLAAAAVAGLVFVPVSPVAAAHLPLAFLPVLLLCTVSFQTGPCAAAVALVAVVGVAVAGCGAGGGPFVPFDSTTAAVLLCLYTGAAGIVTVLVIGARGSLARTAADLATAAREYRLLVDGSPTLICRFRADGALTFANDTLREFVGPAETVARLGLTADREMAEIELACQDLGGRTRWFQWTSRAIGTAADGATEYQAVGVDVTARRAAEEQRRAIERQMFQSAKLESLGVIAGGVAHDFNNILTGVLGNVELAAHELPPGSPAAVYLERAADAAVRAADLNHQLLAYAGKGKFLVRPIDANELLAQTVELVRLSVPKKVEVRLPPSAPLPLVIGDESQLQQVLMNLIINAGDAIGDRPGVITLRTAVADIDAAALTDSSTGRPAKPGRYVTVQVSDTGSGMDAATKAKIFEPFFTTKFTGRGLGLAAVQGIIRGHGGALAVETEFGHGTTFTVFLPEHIPPLAADPPDGTPAEEISVDRIAPRANARRNTVLVVDDEDSVRELTAVILRQIGWNVLTAANGRLGVDVFRTHSDAIACAILDLTMPEMDGMEAMSALRMERPRLPVLLCTGYAEDAVTTTATAAPTGVLLKPFRPADLRQALAELFDATAGGTTPLP